MPKRCGCLKMMRKLALHCVIIIALILLLCGCSGAEDNTAVCTEPAGGAQVILPSDNADVVLPVTQEQRLCAAVEQMSLSDIIYQMMFVTPEAIAYTDNVMTADDINTEHPVGGIIYFASNFVNREQTTDMISRTFDSFSIPPFIGVDEEGGRVARLGNNPHMYFTSHPPMADVGRSGDTRRAYDIGVALGSELKSLGFNVNFAPNSDVLVNPDNTEIGDRSFGSDPYVVAEMVDSVVNGLSDGGVCATLKHFPGHGSTSVDSHTGSSESVRNIDELRSCEFLPFKAGIDAGVDFIMVSHMTLVNATEDKLPSSMSGEVITGMLREELGYEGIVITDSFSMGAVTKEYTPGEAVVMAVKAGADMILMPQDLVTAHDALAAAVESGEISADRIKESVKKILSVKIKNKIMSF